MRETIKTCPKCGAAIPPEAPQGLCPKCVLGGAAETASAAPGSRGAPEPPPLERIVTAFPQLEIIELIGSGGMGAVYKARQPKLERLVALKVLPEALAADPTFAERFSREARVLARLNHPNIVTVYDFGQSGGFFFLIMEYVDGVNLREAMMAGRFSPPQALGIVPRICEALQYAHEEGILHRDIKPENILLDVKGRVKIADFGIAKILDGRVKDVTLTASGAAVGTPHYMAPEQLERPQEVDQRADIYSLGVVFYEMLTGELPIGRFAPPSEKSTVDPRVDPIVLRALEKDRDKRFRSAADVKTRIEDLGAAPAPLPPSPSPAPPAFTGAAKWSPKAVMAAALTAASLCFGLLFFLLGGLTLRLLSSGHARLAKFEILLLLGLPVLALGTGLAGFVLGLMGRREIKDSRGGLRGLGLAHFAIWTLPVSLVCLVLLALVAVPLSFFTLRQTKMVHEPVTVHEALVATGPLTTDGLTLRRQFTQSAGGRTTMARWKMSLAPGRQVTFTFTVSSNGVAVLEQPLTWTLVTPLAGQPHEGQFALQVMPASKAKPPQPQWTAQIEGDPAGAATLAFLPPAPASVQWRILLDEADIQVGKQGTYTGLALEGVQEAAPGQGAADVNWQARLRIQVEPLPGMPEARPGLQIELNPLPVAPPGLPEAEGAAPSPVPSPR